MTSIEKNRKKKKPSQKKTKKKKNKGDVLESVMDSIEMAGASLDFFDEDVAREESPEVSEKTEDGIAEVIETLEASEVEVTETDPDEDTVEINIGALEEGETLDMLPEEERQVEFIEQKQAFSILESLLFSSDRPLGLGTFKQVFKGTSFKTAEIKNALEELQSEYADPSRGVSLEEINGGWQLRTKVDNMDFLRKLAKARPFRLSGPALEVLAIISYKQPMIKSEIDEIRGVESGHLVRALMEKNLVCFQGKSELPGKPMQYGTSRKFLEIFGLRNLRELPSLDEIDQLLPDGIGAEEEKETLSDVTDGLVEQYGGNYSEGEEELLKIEDTLGGIDTSTEFFEQEKVRQREKRDSDRAQDIREALDVGEEVETKDQRWLTRYDEKVEAIALEKENAEATVMAADSMAADSDSDKPMETVDSTDEIIGAEVRESERLRDELSTLSADSLVDESVLATDDALEDDDSEEEVFDPFADNADPIE